MTTINPVQTPVDQSPAFRGKTSILKNILKSGKKADKTNFNKALEQMNGFAYANKVQNPVELQETVMRETIAGNLDFLKGINEYLSKNKANTQSDKIKKVATDVISPKTGTTISKRFLQDGYMRKTIQYGKNTRLAKIGIDSVEVTTGKDAYKSIDFSNNGKHLLYVRTVGGKGNISDCSYDAIYERVYKPLIDMRSFNQTIRNFIDHMASKSKIQDNVLKISRVRRLTHLL